MPRKYGGFKRFAGIAEIIQSQSCYRYTIPQASLQLYRRGETATSSRRVGDSQPIYLFPDTPSSAVDIGELVGGPSALGDSIVGFGSQKLVINAIK